MVEFFKMETEDRVHTMIFLLDVHRCFLGISPLRTQLRYL